MAPIPSSMASRELNLDRGPSALRPAQAVPARPPVPPSPRQKPPRPRSGVSIGRVVLFIAVLAAVAAGAWWFLCGRGNCGKAKCGEDYGGTRRHSVALAEFPEELRPVVEYLRPSSAEVKLWLDSVLASSYINEKWGELARNVSLKYLPEEDEVNAFAFYDKEKAGRPSIALCGGWVRLSRLIGALALVQSSAEAQGVEKDIKAYLGRVSVIVAEKGMLSEETVIDLLDEFEVGTAVFQNVGAVSTAKGVADGVCKATLAHEFGHLAGGHSRGADLNKTVSQNEERQADLFASSIAASIANGQQMLGGQILTWYTIAIAETINPSGELFRSHPYSVDRLRSAIDANKSLAASLGISVEDVDELIAEISAGDDEGQAEKSSGETRVASAGEAGDESPTRPRIDRHHPIVVKTIDSYLKPSKDDLEQHLVAIKGSKHVRAKYSDVAAATEFVYLPEDNRVDAKATVDRQIRLFGGMVRVACTMGAVLAFGTPADDSDAGTAFIRELGARIRDRGGFTEGDVEDFLERYKVDFRGFISQATRSKAEIIADAIIKATLAHEFGHLALGHLNGDDANHDISQIEEKDADRFASKIAASDSRGADFFVGQVYSMIVLAFSEKKKEVRDHPEAKERLIDVIRDNREWAEATSITEEDIREFFEENAPLSPTDPLPVEPRQDKAYQASGSAATDGGGDAPSIVLPGGRKTLRLGTVAEVRKELSEKSKSLAEEDEKARHHILRALPTVRASAVRKAFAASGVEEFSFCSGGAWQVTATDAQYLKLLDSNLFDGTRPYSADDKGVPLAAPDEGGKGFAEGEAQNPIYVVSLFKGADGAAVRRMLSGISGCELLSGNAATIRVRATEAAFHQICAIEDVRSVTEWLEPSLNNDVAVEAMHVRDLWPSARKGIELSDKAVASPAQNSLGLTGKGQIVAVCDSGLDTGDFATLHPDVKGRVVKAFAYGRPTNTKTWEGDWSDESGHGSHVMGSVLGNGSASGGKYRGPAFEAELVVQSTGGEQYLFLSEWGLTLKCDLDGFQKLSEAGRFPPMAVLSDAYNFKTPDGRSPRIHSDSWGYNDKKHPQSHYLENAQSFDKFTFEHPDLLVVTSSGNYSLDRVAPFGVMDTFNVGDPGTSKNALTVGAAESFRTEGGNATNTWGVSTYEPICKDFVSRPYGGKRGMAAFSSRGPCPDDRIKPDVVAPGTDILSIRSQAKPALPSTWGPFNQWYHFMGGTSMATPLVAGTAALVRQWLVERRGIANPDAATMKAVLCAGAKSLYPGQYGEEKFLEIPKQYPNNVEGWGIVNLENSVANPDGVAVWDGEVIWEATNRTFRVTAPGGKPLCILMAYADYEGEINGGGLVNDIDLTVTDPSGKIWYPNSLGHPDRVNNVEGVRFDNAPSGEYVITVSDPPLPPTPGHEDVNNPFYRSNGGITWPMDPKFTGGRDDAIRFSLVANGASPVPVK